MKSVLKDCNNNTIKSGAKSWQYNHQKGLQSTTTIINEKWVKILKP